MKEWILIVFIFLTLLFVISAYLYLNMDSGEGNMPGPGPSPGPSPGPGPGPSPPDPYIRNVKKVEVTQYITGTPSITVMWIENGEEKSVTLGSLGEQHVFDSPVDIIRVSAILYPTNVGLSKIGANFYDENDVNVRYISTMEPKTAFKKSYIHSTENPGFERMSRIGEGEPLPEPQGCVGEWSDLVKDGEPYCSGGHAYEYGVMFQKYTKTFEIETQPEPGGEPCPSPLKMSESTRVGECRGELL